MSGKVEWFWFKVTLYLLINFNFYLELKNEINCLDFSEDGSAFATAGKDLTVRIYDTKTCKVSITVTSTNLADSYS